MSADDVLLKIIWLKGPKNGSKYYVKKSVQPQFSNVFQGSTTISYDNFEMQPLETNFPLLFSTIAIVGENNDLRRSFAQVQPQCMPQCMTPSLDQSLSKVTCPASSTCRSACPPPGKSRDQSLNAQVCWPSPGKSRDQSMASCYTLPHIINYQQYIYDLHRHTKCSLKCPSYYNHKTLIHYIKVNVFVCIFQFLLKQ